MKRRKLSSPSLRRYSPQLPPLSSSSSSVFSPFSQQSSPQSQFEPPPRSSSSDFDPPPRRYANAYFHHHHHHWHHHVHGQNTSVAASYYNTASNDSMTHRRSTHQYSGYDDDPSLPDYAYPYDYQSSDNRKRARRQAAGNLVSGFMGGTTTAPAPQQQPGITASGRKSTAQPRPNIRIPPKGIGPVYDPNINDVLCGRGGRINAHAGNVQFRELVHSRKRDYLSSQTKKLEKAHIAAGIVRQIREMNPPGRFLKEERDGGWYDIGDLKAIKKVGQALREDAPDIRNELDHDGSDGEDQPTPTPSKPVKSIVPAATVTLTLPAGAMGPPASTVTPPQQPVMAVSGRGGAKAGGMMPPSNQYRTSTPDQQQYQPIAYQHLTPPPTYQPIVPPQRQQQSQQQHPPSISVPQLTANVGMRGMMPKKATNAGFSGAAAAIMEDGQDEFQAPISGDFAFGKTFHPADAPGGDSSMISGMSGSVAGPAREGTVLSGMSGISELTNPMSSLSGAGDIRSPTRGQMPMTPQTQQAVRMSQLNQLRQQWAAQNQQYQQQVAANGGNIPPPPGAAPFLNSNSTAGFGNSLMQRTLSLNDVTAANDGSSWAEHSLVGGGIRGDEGSIFGGGTSVMSGLSGMNNSVAMGQSIGTMNTNELMAGLGYAFGGSDGAAAAAAAGFAPSVAGRTTGSRSGRVMARGDMSICSGEQSLLSVSASIMSELSENLVALDLAEPKFK